ncbi:hypothetical protein NHP190003_00360 [Helicobacter sp. NHP19-003]|uniref:Penicillin-binding protein activator LpoB n=1 Tax=Helicobacter gastrocanis TaxID=2849641 RepID=A0ABM7S807_9HELI|nr:penicillin-binding protein activator LpoB [Helicobacter sp. NHP19-003]BCZ16754.1 hypothetical protein NHP190003_00360 [Helicobacter sp. NHP19-003]
MRQRFLISLLAGAFSLGVVGCNSTPTPTAKHAWPTSDAIVATTKSALGAMLKSPQIQQLQGAVFGVVDVMNGTKKRLNTEQLTQMVLKTLQEMGKDRFFAKRAVVEGDSEDNTIKQTEQMRNTQTTPKPPSLFLNVSVVQRQDNQHATYVLEIEVVKIATGLQVWSGEFPISH